MIFFLVVGLLVVVVCSAALMRWGCWGLLFIYWLVVAGVCVVLGWVSILDRWVVSIFSDWVVVVVLAGFWGGVMVVW